MDVLSLVENLVLKFEQLQLGNELVNLEIPCLMKPGEHQSVIRTAMVSNRRNQYKGYRETDDFTCIQPSVDLDND